MSQTNNTYKPGESDERPWGRWAVLATGAGYAVKEIVVNPGEILSLQSHQHRAEHWIIIEGTAEVTIGDDKRICEANSSIFIPLQAKHRIANVGDGPMRFVEVQTGAILSEDDIERFEDNYGRTA